MSEQLATIQIEQRLADSIFAAAQARGLSIGDYLRVLLVQDNDPPQAAQLSLSEVDRLLDELSAGTEHIPVLPLTFSRADIYFDHD